MATSSATEQFYQLASAYQRTHLDHKMVMSFWDYLELIQQQPSQFLRNSSQYLTDMFEHYQTHPTHELCSTSYKSQIFDIATPERDAVIGGERPQQQLIDALRSFVTLGGAFKLLLLHGPNGSSKSTTIASITGAMEDYSHTDQGALYKFSWIFSKDKQMNSSALDPSITIGFTDGSAPHSSQDFSSLAGLEEAKISAKINSEFRENPIYLLPMPLRQQFLESLNLTAQPTIAMPNHIWCKGLSKKNQDIFDHLLAAYNGNLRDVLRHVQVERFHFSRHYRHGIATVEPQMSVDAAERQVTMDRYLKELPAVLSTISFYEYSGALVDGNRGVVEFSDFLKRPLETFKYLLNTIELRSVQLNSATALLDTVFVATTNDKHWEAFAALPDFNSFRGRIHLITVPYLLEVDQEIKIYHHDYARLQTSTTIAPHTAKILCLFAVMTRLRPPDPTPFETKHSATLKAVTPLLKAAIYNGDIHQPHRDTQLTKAQKSFLHHNTVKLKNQYVYHSHYEGKFGASPRLIRDILHSAAREAKAGHLTAVDILATLTKLVTRDDLYEFLRLKPDGVYHKPTEFIALLQHEYQTLFEYELLESMAMAESQQYQKLLSDYINHVVHAMRREKIVDPTSGTHQSPDDNFMKTIESTIGVTKDHQAFRESLLARLASYKIDNPNATINLDQVFDDLVKKIKQHYYSSKRAQIATLCQNILKAELSSDEQLSADEHDEVHRTLYHLNQHYGYHKTAAIRSLQLCLKQPHSKLKAPQPR